MLNNYFMLHSYFQAATEFLNDFTMEELMGFLFGAGMDWSDVDDQTSTSAPLTTALPSY